MCNKSGLVLLTALRSSLMQRKSQNVIDRGGARVCLFVSHEPSRGEIMLIYLLLGTQHFPSTINSLFNFRRWKTWLRLTDKSYNLIFTHAWAVRMSAFGWFPICSCPTLHRRTTIIMSFLCGDDLNLSFVFFWIKKFVNLYQIES